MNTWWDRYVNPPTGAQTARQHLTRKVVRRIHWARTEGIGRVIEEDRIDPRPRIRAALRKRSWRRTHRIPAGSAVPVYVVGLQRSGTNMLMRGLDEAPETEVRNENDRTLFHRFRIRSLDVLRSTVLASKQQFIFVKPICDSQLLDQLLDIEGLQPGRGLWVYRDVDSRARSEVSKFGPANLLALRAIAAGQGESRWQGERLPQETVEMVRSFDLEQMTPITGAVLFWAIRNQLFFTLGFAKREDVLLVSYDAFAAEPALEMRRLCGFVGVTYRPELDEHVDRRTSHGTEPLDIDPRVRALASDVADRLESARTVQNQRESEAPSSATTERSAS